VKFIFIVLLGGIAAAARAGDFDCVIEPRQVIELRSPLEGLIDKINVDRGDIVKKGQELVLLDTSLERAQAAIARQRSQMEGAVRSGESRVEFSTKKHERAENLHGQNYLSAQARDEAALDQPVDQAEPQAGQDVIRKFSGEWTKSRYVQATEAYDHPILERLKADARRNVIFPSPAELATAGEAFETVIEAWSAQRSPNRELLKLVHAEIAKSRADGSQGRAQ